MSKEIRETVFLMMLIMFITALPVFVIAYFDHPSADDYIYSYSVSEAVKGGGSVLEILKAAFDTSMSFMQSWQGLYSSAFLLALQPAVFGERAYMLTPFIIIGILYIGIFMLIKAFAKYVLASETKGTFIIATFVMFYLIQALPSPVEGLYWYNGAVNYLFFLGLVLIHISLMLKYFFANDKGLVIMAVSTFLCFIISGGNHITSFMCILINICFCVFALVLKRKYFVFAPAVSGIIGFLIMYNAPGTAIRQAYFEKSSVAETIMLAAYDTLISDKYVNLSTIFLLALITPWVADIILKSKKQGIFKAKYFFAFLVFDFVIISAMEAVPIYAMGGYGTGRILDTIFVAYVLLTVITYSYGAGCIICHNKDGIRRFAEGMWEKRKSFIKIALMSMVLYIAIIGKGNAINSDSGSTAMKASLDMLTGKAAAHDKVYMERLEVYMDENVKDAVFPELDYGQIPETIQFLDDISEDPNVWTNKAIAKFYGKNSVRTERDAE